MKKNIKEFMKFEDPWRVFRIMAEFVEGFEQFSKIGQGGNYFWIRTDEKNS